MTSSQYSSPSHPGGTWRRTVRVVGAVLILLPIGCVSSPPPEPMVGMTVSQVESALPDATLITYDLSTPVLGLDPTYTSLQASVFTVISACGNTLDNAGKVVPLGVIPSKKYSNAVRSEALEGDFDKLLNECNS